MNNIDKIANIIRETMLTQGATKPTLAIIYDSILQVYPKLKTESQERYNCHRKIIIEQITDYYDKKNRAEKESLVIILSKMIQECKS